MIEQRKGYPVHLQRLIFNGACLDVFDDGSSLEGVGLRQGSTVNLVLRLKAIEDIRPEELSDFTLRGRDWLAERKSDDGQFVELPFDFGWCAPRHSVGAKDVHWQEIAPESSLTTLRDTWARVRKIALHIRHNNARWLKTLSEAHAAASAAIESCRTELESAVAAVRIRHLMMILLLLPCCDRFPESETHWNCK